MLNTVIYRNVISVFGSYLLTRFEQWYLGYYYSCQEDKKQGASALLVMQLRKMQVTQMESSDLRTTEDGNYNLRIELRKLDAMDAIQGRYK